MLNQYTQDLLNKDLLKLAPEDRKKRDAILKQLEKRETQYITSSESGLSQGYCLKKAVEHSQKWGLVRK